MKKLRCRSYLNQATNPEQLCAYVGHLFRAHGKNRPSISSIVKLTASATPSLLNYEKIHSKVTVLANQFDENYGLGE